MSLLCGIGWHRYKTVPVIQCLMPFVHSSLDGDICKSCGRMRPSDLEWARLTLGDMQRINPKAQYVVYGEIVE